MRYLNIILCTLLAGALVWGGINEYHLRELKGGISKDISAIGKSLGVSTGYGESDLRLDIISPYGASSVIDEIKDLQTQISSIEGNLWSIKRNLSSIETDLQYIQMQLR